MIRVVNMIPQSLSGEVNQDSEPNIAVNPAQPSDIVATALTPAPGGSFAPIYVSTDHGATWSLRNVVPGNGSVGTGDITVGFATASGVLYAGILNGDTGDLQILRAASFASTTPMTVLVERADEDQPWVIAGTVVAGPDNGQDRVYVGNNDFNQTDGATATVDRSLDAATAAAPAGFAPFAIERRATVGQDGPPVRIALHSDGTVYAAFQRWVSGSGLDFNVDVVVTRDDAWASGTDPFGALVDPVDGAIGQRVVTGRFIRFNAQMGQERLGSDLAIAVDPADSSNVWLAWCDRVGGAAGTDWTMHVRRSTDRGQTWSSGDLRTITNGKNPALAVNSAGRVALLFQEFTGVQWVTQLELTDDAWATPAENLVLHRAPSAVPARTFLPFLGDYVGCSRSTGTSMGSSAATTPPTWPTSRMASATSATPTSRRRRCWTSTPPRRWRCRSTRSSSSGAKTRRRREATPTTFRGRPASASLQLNRDGPRRQAAVPRSRPVHALRGPPGRRKD